MFSRSTRKGRHHGCRLLTADPSNLKDVLSFRKARLDTCQVCDKTMNRMGHLMALRKRTLSQDDELQDLKSFKSAHLRESEIIFASLKYDVTVLASKV